MFDDKSRHAKLPTYLVPDLARDRLVPVVPVTERPTLIELGIHLRRQHERLDHLAAKYLADPAGFWLLCEANDVMWPDALAEAREISIPRKGR